MIADDFIQSLACLTAWRFGRKAGINGMVAVLFVLRNRVQQNLGNWLQNIAALESAGDGEGTYPDVRDPEFQQLLQSVAPIYDGSRVDNLTDGALHFVGSGGAGEPLQRIAVVGSMNFYK